MKFIVQEKNSDMTLGDYLKKELGMSRRLINKMKANNSIFVNNQPRWTNTRLRKNDIVETVFLSKNSENIIPQKIDGINILFEDENLIAFEKPFNMPSHPSKGHLTNTLANHILWYYNENNINTAVRISGRLDKDTSGLILVCKNQYIQNVLSKSSVKKEYLLVCHGILKEKNGILDFPIKSYDGLMKRGISDEGKNAITKYEVLEEKNNLSLVKAELLTGRTHQIRLHFSHIGNPLLGDRLYGFDDGFHRQALHSYRIKTDFNSYNFTSNLYYDIQQFWNLQ